MQDATVPQPFRVATNHAETGDTWTLTLEPEAGRFEFAPGQFTMLYAFGTGEVPISVSGDPRDPTRLVHTVRAVGAVTRAICEARDGQVLGVRGPFGSAWPMTAAGGGDVVVVAGGVGLAPLRPAIYQLLAERARYGRAIVLYGGRTPDQLLFRDELLQWGGRDDVELGITVDAAGEDWRGQVGVVPGMIGRAEIDPERTTAFVCGPEIMMRFAVEALLESGMPGERIFVSMERNMRCAVGHCGHCQLGTTFVCRDGPVFDWTRMERYFRIREV